ncbi:MAG: DNA-directed RNA polymerase subunit M [Promethearchaeota archaeon]|nr:MAG: DNA-directed RNA polymerase subunit M [Candidatus Lokiarchaeota archaeon]
MEFCPECGSLMLPSEGKAGRKIFKCKCGYVKPFSEDEANKYKIYTKIKRDFKDEVINTKEIIEWKEKNLKSSLKDFKCPSCGYVKCSLKTMQTRSADEGMTI